jgi:phospholipase/lecithinase/hemolysin
LEEESMRLLRSFGLLALLAALASVAQAGSFTYVAVFGDSLSDNGNLYGTIGYPPPPYYNGRMSNGPVAVENLASDVSSPLHDYAWIGATTGVGNVVDNGTATTLGSFGLPGMSTVFAAVAPSLPATSNALFVLWGGPNDLLSDLGTPAALPGAMANAVANISNMALFLESIGAQHILVPNMPDLGLTPRLLALGPVVSAEGTEVTDLFNALLAASLPPGVTMFDTAGFLRAIDSNPAAYGFLNVTNACFDGVTVCADPNQYLFWDDIHPTAAADVLLGAQFAAAVPEPSTMVLVLAGLCAVVAATRRRRTS